MSPQVNPLPLPADGETAYGQKIRDAFETLRVAHNSTDTTATGASTAAGAKYALPGTGVPKTDMAASVQTSLGKADTALQQETYASALTGQRFDIIWDGVTLPTRPTTRADIYFDITGPLPAPTATQMTTGGYKAGDCFVEAN